MDEDTGQNMEINSKDNYVYLTILKPKHIVYLTHALGKANKLQ